MSRPAWLFLGLACAGLAARVGCAAPSPRDFAYGMPITTPAQAAAYRVAVPLEVYRKAVHEDLRDVRIFNARGEVVPYELQQPQPLPLARTEGRAVPLFALRGDSRATLDGVRVTIRSQGTAVNVESGMAPGPAPAITSYVVDAREVLLPLYELQLHWPQDAAQFSGNIRVESSDDLGAWQTVKAEAPVLNLRTADARLVEGGIELQARRAKFWRLTWVGKTAPFELTAVTARTTPDRRDPQRASLTVAGAAVSEKHEEYAFDLAARLPVNQVNVDLPEANSVARIQLLSRSQAADPWRPIARGEFYRVRNAAAERRNEPIAIATDSDRYWLARLEPPGTPTGDDPPRLEVSWNRQDIVFLARGNGPFLLAYGSGTAGAANAALASLLTGVIVVRAAPGAPYSLGGAERLRAAPPGFPWKMAVLWGVLGIGVILLAAMAYRLSRELSKPPAGRQP